ncbi:MAG: hypothetical protein EAX87_12190 [Candidatus Thorarchaeota archaeon]|nr:hypothetical protein [Candidatus Thorarchaeota archaeon]
MTESIRYAIFFSARDTDGAGGGKSSTVSATRIGFGVGSGAPTIGSGSAFGSGALTTGSGSGSGIIFFLGAPAIGSSTFGSPLYASTPSSKAHLPSKTPRNSAILFATSWSASSFSIISTKRSDAIPIVVIPT